MNVICTFKDNQQTHGICATLSKLNHTVAIWSPEHKPIFDIFDEVKPDIFFCHQDFVNPLIDDVLYEYKNIKFVGLSDSKFPLKKQPDLVCLETSTLYDPFHPLDGYEGERIFYKDYANVALYNSGTPQKKLETDLLYLSLYKNPRDDVLIPTLRFLAKQFQLKIFGNHTLPLPEYLGMLPPSDISNAMASAKVAIDIYDFNRYDYATNKTCCIVNHTNKEDIWESSNKFNELADKIQLLLNEENKRKSLINKAFNFVKKDQTYFHFCAKILSVLGFPKEAEKCLEELKELL